MKGTILLTGSEGLIGQELSPLLQAAGYTVISLDNALNSELEGCIDIRDTARVEPLLHRCDGIVQLAAVSRVVWGERDPTICRQVNVEALDRIVRTALEAAGKPWLIFASSREVYGQQETLPVGEDAILKPMNVYAHSKVAGEEIVGRASEAGLRTAIVRLSNVFGRWDDHVDRVIPAFCRAALEGTPLRIDGRANTFDFTWAPEVARGLATLVDLMASQERAPPPIHFTSQRPITLGEAATTICELSGSRSELVDAPSRHFDVARFVGDNGRARSVLGWSPQRSFEEAIAAFLTSREVLA